jgi:hypothetical protein
VASGLHVLVGQGRVRLASSQTDGRDGDRAALTRVAHPIPMGRCSADDQVREGTASMLMLMLRRDKL